MEQNLVIRQERESDYARVEQVIRQAFYNIYTPGCTEHYLAHVIRPHPDFLPELDLVLELDGQVIGSIMYTRSTLVDEAGAEKGILTFGPVCIQPGYQRRGLGRQLVERALESLRQMGIHKTALVVFARNQQGNAFWERMGFTLRTDILYRNRALTEMTRIDT